MQSNAKAEFSRNHVGLANDLKGVVIGEADQRLPGTSPTKKMAALAHQLAWVGGTSPLKPNTVKAQRRLVSTSLALGREMNRCRD